MNPIIGLPGIGTERTTRLKKVLITDFGRMFTPQNYVVDSTLSRDPTNTGDTGVLQPGMVLGFVTSSGKLAPSIIGVVATLYNGGTTLNVSAATAAEIVRRIGSTGTFKLTAAPTAAGTVRTQTITYSAVNTSTGDITVTAANINEVQTIAIGGSTSAGTFKLGIPLSTGQYVWTDTIAWNGTFGTVVTNMNTALDDVLGAGKVVASGSAFSAITLTFSGAGYSAYDDAPIMVDTSALTGATTVTVANTTTGVDGRAVVGSFIQPTDGSETPVFVIPDGYGILLQNQDGTYQDVQTGELLIGGFIKTGQIINYPSDASLKAWLKASLRSVGYAWAFSDSFNL